MALVQFMTLIVALVFGYNQVYGWRLDYHSYYYPILVVIFWGIHVHYRRAGQTACRSIIMERLRGRHATG